MTQDERYEQIIERMAILSEPMRIKILLEIASKKELRGKDILERFSVTQPTMSHHLNILTSSGLIEVRKEGRCIWYSINKENMAEIKEVILAISDSKALRKSPVTESKPVTRKAPATKEIKVTNSVSSSNLKKKSSVPKPKQTIEVPDIEELKKNKKKKKDKDKAKDSKSDKKKKDKKKKK